MTSSIDAMTSKIKIALVGCGRISVKHISAILDNCDQAELVALCDVDENQLTNTKDQFFKLYREKSHSPVDPKIQTYTNYEHLLSDCHNDQLKVDLIVLATPSGLHPQQTIMAAQENINICTEKPMATRWADGLEMVKSCDEAKVKLFVVKQNRLNRTVQLVKEQIEKGLFGRLYLITANVFWTRPQSYYDQASWRGTWEFDGGALMNQASHYVDLLDWLIGPLESVNATTATIGRRIEVEDTATLQLRWRNGALGTMAVTMLTYPKNLEGSITILGEHGSVKIGGPALNKIEYWQFSGESTNVEKLKDVNYEIDNVYGNGHSPYYKNMLGSLLGRNKPLSDGREGLRSLELLVCAYLSARDGHTVHLPLVH